MSRSLTDQRVHILRTANKSDRYFERLWRVGVQAIRQARVGITWKHHTTPPDNRPRVPKGNWNAPLPTTSTPEHP